MSTEIEKVESEVKADNSLPIEPEAVNLTVEGDIEATKLGFWVSDADPHAEEWKSYGELSGKAEGETQDQFQAYIESAYVLRKLMVQHVSEQGDAYDRPRFVKKASAVQMANGVSSDLSSEHAINRKLLAYGIVALIRSSIVDNMSAPEPIRTTPQTPPMADFYGGNLYKDGLLALAPLFKSNSKSKKNVGADVVVYKDHLFEKFANEMVAGMRGCTVPRSGDYVSARVKEKINSVEAYHEKVASARMSLSERQQAAQDKVVKELNAKIHSATSRILTAAEVLRDECKLSKQSIRDKLLEHRIINPLESSDVMGLIAKAESRTPVVEALAQQNVSDSDAEILCQHTINRAKLLEACARTMTESDAKLLGQFLCARFDTDPTASKPIIALKIAITPVLKVVMPPKTPAAANGHAKASA
jgi:hypothetical protein